MAELADAPDLGSVTASDFFPVTVNEKTENQQI